MKVSLAVLIFAVVNVSAICQMPLALQHGDCLTHTQANLTATRLRGVLTFEGSDLGTPAETAEQILAEDYSDAGDVYAMLYGDLDDVGRYAVHTKQEELDAVGEGRPARVQKGFQTIELGVVSCRKIFWFWNMTKFNDNELKYPIRGMHLLDMDDHLRIRHLYSEANGLAFAANSGFDIKYANGTVLPTVDLTK